MQTIFRVINIVFSPVLTLEFASRFSGFTIAGKNAGDAAGAAIAGLIVLTIELCLTQGPKYSAWLRRWLDPRAAFEGIWMQHVHSGGNNRVAVFSMRYHRDDDTFGIRGEAYSASGDPWAKWSSTHMFIDAQHLKATYRWEGDVLGNVPISESDKSGLTELDLRKPASFALPMSGDGEVFHVGEASRIKFRFTRVTNRYLKELGLPFALRDLWTNANDEERKLVNAYLGHRAGAATGTA